MNWTGDKLEEFIIENKDKFPKYEPKSNHQEHFLIKLSRRFKKLISIVPYLIRVLIVTILIFGLSILVWYKFLNHPKVDTIIEKIDLKNNI
jgi:hypothetical protein